MFTLKVAIFSDGFDKAISQYSSKKTSPDLHGRDNSMAEKRAPLPTTERAGASD